MGRGVERCEATLRLIHAAEGACAATRMGVTLWGKGPPLAVAPVVVAKYDRVPLVNLKPEAMNFCVLIII